LLVFIEKKITELHQILKLFYGPRFKRKELSERFHNWRKTVQRLEIEKNEILSDGSRSQYSEQFKNWKWIIIQTILWLSISLKFDFNPVINLMAFFTIFNQFIHNILSIAQDKRQIFNNFITQEILSMLSFSNLLWEKISDLNKEDEIMKAERSNIPSEIEWTDIFIELLPNEFDDDLPFLRIRVGHEQSEILHPLKLGLVKCSDHKKQNGLFIILKAFGKHGSFIFNGNTSQRKSIEKLIDELSKNLTRYFGLKDLMPIIKNDQSASWECFININDKTNSWHQLELKRYQDVRSLLSDWVPLNQEVEKIDKSEESYKMKGYEW
tara:strand:+ start:242 stop:1213 length:972 start_codon:yes stop_codon:yes gene_type:complete